MGERPIYQARQVPEHLMTLQQLRELGLRPADLQCPDAFLQVALFDRRTAVAVAPPPSAAQRVTDQQAATNWARHILANPDVVILDLESTDLHGRVVEMAVVATGGEVLFETLINPEGEPINSEASAKHGITDVMVAAAHVPRFGDIIEELTELLRGKQIVGWNTAHDHAVLIGEVDRLAAAGYVVHTPWLETTWQDAMLQYAAWCGDWDELVGQYRRHKLDGAHRALGDCQAVLHRLHEMGAGPPSPKEAEPDQSSRRGGEPWDAAEEDLLARLYQEGVEVTQIAEQLHRSELAVRFRLHKLDLVPFPADAVKPSVRPPKPPPAYRLDDLRKVHPNSHKKWTADEDARLARRAADGATIEQLVAEFGRNANGIQARLARHVTAQPTEPPF